MEKNCAAATPLMKNPHQSDTTNGQNETHAAMGKQGHSTQKYAFRQLKGSDPFSFQAWYQLNSKLLEDARKFELEKLAPEGWLERFDKPVNVYRQGENGWVSFPNQSAV